MSLHEITQQINHEIPPAMEIPIKNPHFSPQKKTHEIRATPQPLRRQHRVGLRHQRRRFGRLAPAAAAADAGDAQTSGDRGRLKRLKRLKGWEKVEKTVEKRC